MWLAVASAYFIYELILLNLIGKHNENFRISKQPTKFSDFSSNDKGTCVGWFYF